MKSLLTYAYSDEYRTQVLGHAFERAEEPRAVPFYGAANRPPVLLPVEGRFDAGPAILHFGKVVGRHEIVVTEVAELLLQCPEVRDHVAAIPLAVESQFRKQEDRAPGILVANVRCNE